MSSAADDGDSSATFDSQHGADGVPSGFAITPSPAHELRRETSSEEFATPRAAESVADVFAAQVNAGSPNMETRRKEATAPLPIPSGGQRRGDGGKAAGKAAKNSSPAKAKAATPPRDSSLAALSLPGHTMFKVRQTHIRRAPKDVQLSVGSMGITLFNGQKPLDTYIYA